MLWRIILLCVFIHTQTLAFTVKTIKDGNWEDASAWSNNAVPTSPDSIIVSHYIIINQNLIIQANCILLVDSTGTICGDYQLRTICADAYNYGHIYLNSLKISAHFYNYNILQCKTSIILTACSATQSGSFHNMPPYGATSVWPPVLCKTIDTNWEGGNTSLEEFEINGLKVYPNPVTNETLTIETTNATTLNVYDFLGKPLQSISVKGTSILNLNGLSPGVYLIEIELEGKKVIKKILKSN